MVWGGVGNFQGLRLVVQLFERFELIRARLIIGALIIRLGFWGPIYFK